MRWSSLGLPVCLWLTASLAQGAHAAAVQHHCGGPPFNFNMTQAPPEALADPIFQNPWVQNNVAVTYDPLTTKDGLGSQIHRQLGVYAVAACTGLQYKPTTGFQRFTHLNQSDAHMLARRVDTMLGIPSAFEPLNPTWRVVHFGRDCNITWDTLLTEVKAALAQQQPTLFNISFVYGFALTYPAMLGCVPAFMQQPPVCGAPLLRPVRVAVHIRAGDAEHDPNRLLPHSYFYNIICVVTKILRNLQRDYVVEVYTQAAFGIRYHDNGSYHRISRQEYVQELHKHIGRHMVLLADQDNSWTFSQMTTADIFVHSKSTLSIAAGIMNTQGINIAPPKGSLPWPWLQGPHWLHPANVSGRFDSAEHAKLVAEIQGRFGPPCRGRLLDDRHIGKQKLQHVRREQQLMRR